MEEDVREIQVGKISPNLRTVCTEEGIEEIVQSIRTHGQQEPILIWYTHDSFRILDGEKRWRACRRLGMNTVKAIIAEVSV